MLMSKENLPKWYDGPLLEGREVTNPYSGATRTLNDVEFTIYAMILNTERDVERNGGVFNPATAPLQDKMAKGIAWFRNNSVDAYFDLID
jgi:hypothetical protein